MVSVYIRRRKKIVFFYTRRRRGFGEQELSPLLSSNEVYSLKEVVQNKGVFSSVNDLVDIGLSDGLPAPCTSEKNQGNSEVEFEKDETVIKRNQLDNIDLSTEGSLHEEVTKANIPVDIGLDNNEPLLSVIQEFPSTLCFQRRPRSARKYGGLPRLINNEPLLSVIKQLPFAKKCLQRRHRSSRKSTLLASRRHNIIECSTSDDSEQIASHLGASSSSCFEISPKTPIKDDRISKFTPDSLLCDVQGLLSTGVLAGALVKYKKDNLELLGVVSTSGICCGCSLCKFEQVVSSFKFEKHAGSKSCNQNAHIFLENGMSLYALSKVLKNVSLGSLAEVMEEKFGYLANKAVNMAWKGNPMMHYNKGKSRGQKHFSDLLHELQTSKNFPKGARSTRAVRPPLSLISKVNQVSRQLVFCDVDLQQCPAHKKRGVDIKSSKELYLKDSSKVASADPYESNIGDISQKLKTPHSLICQNNANSSIKYTLDRPPLTISCLLTNGLLERLLEHYKKDRIKLLRCIKGIGISFGCSSHHLNEVLSLNFEKHGGASSMKSKDYIFLNDKLALYALVEEFGKVPLGLLPGELIQKMIGCQPNDIRSLAWKEPFHRKEINLQSSTCDDGKNQSAHMLLHIRPRAERLMLSASENNLPLPPGNSVEVSVSRKAKKTMKHRELDFHQQIFELLNDGTKLSYYSHGKEILEGYKFGKNILCSCCNSMLSASKFEAHAGHEKRRKPYHSIYTSYGKSLHQIAMFLLLDDLNNKDMSMTDKAGGKSSFTLRCHNAHNAGGQSSNTCSPFGFQLGRIFQAPCNLGCCTICRGGDATLNFGNICDSTMLFCGQCCRMFHVGCLRLHGICDIKARPSPPDTWLCGDKCIKIRADLLNFVQDGPISIPESLLTSMHSSVGSAVHTHTQIDVHWQLLSGRFHGDKSKLLLQQAMKIFQEAFGAVYKGYRDVLSTMVNGEKGVAEFFGGMFCAVVAVKSKIVSVALLRVFGNHVAELPLAATTNDRRGQGFFKILFLKIEEILSFMKVENLILPADDHSLSMWVQKFGFINLSTEEIREYQMNHRIVMFENTTMLQKPFLPQVKNP
ncbi:uncharacterized protein LOC110093937 isoform X1 [Dendrobium catenatum]|nr:uncharacterized protein LOC110093937 isoform X1 [Dendrobium catenatum]